MSCLFLSQNVKTKIHQTINLRAFVYESKSWTLNLGEGEGNFLKIFGNRQIPVTVRLKAQVCSRLIIEIAAWNPAEGIDVRLLCKLCVV
jgi:hypothetical protein